MSAPTFERVALIGTGLIGSSLARAMRRRRLAKTLVACDESEKTRKRLRELNIADDVVADAVDACADADLIALCAPLGRYEEIAQQIGKILSPKAILTDVGSVKAEAMRALRPHLRHPRRFVPGHPVAGTEFSGPDAGFAELFDGRQCILTPDNHVDPDATDAVERLWTACGAATSRMSAEKHDAILAVTSHAPHLIAYALATSARKNEDVTENDVIAFSAAGFRDFTRIAASDPIMWRDILLQNREPALKALDRFLAAAEKLRDAMKRDDGDALIRTFADAREVRRRIVAEKHDTQAPDFGRRDANK